MTKEPNAVWPVKVTPFKASGGIDYDAIAPLAEWYWERGVRGYFTTCAMSEMVSMSLKERAALPAAVKKHSKAPVAASGHISFSFDDQVDELKAVEDSGADVVVMLTNRIALPGAGTDVWKENLSRLMAKLDKGTRLGLYEWPGQPGVWRVTDEELEFAAKTGRFVFMKDTCCNLGTLARRAKIAEGTNLRVYNANAASYLASLRYGCHGFCGIMANFHPELYAWLADHYKDDAAKSDLVQSFLTVASFGEGRVSPVGAKYHISKTGAPINIYSRNRDYRELTAMNRYEFEQMALLADWVKAQVGVPVKETGGEWDSAAAVAAYREYIGSPAYETAAAETAAAGASGAAAAAGDRPNQAYIPAEPIQI